MSKNKKRTIKEFEKLARPKNTFLDFFREAPLPNVDIDTERNKDTGREILFLTDEKISE